MNAATSKALARPAKILLISHNKAGCTARKTILEEEGFTVSTAGSSDDAVELFDKELFDLVITNYTLGKTNGAELIERLRAKRADISVVILSGLVDVLGLNERNTGADAVIQKSAHEVAHLLRTVRRLTAKRKAPGGRKPPGQQARRVISGTETGT